jgi:hypothetical protein
MAGRVTNPERYFFSSGPTIAPRPASGRSVRLPMAVYSFPGGFAMTRSMFPFALLMLSMVPCFGLPFSPAAAAQDGVPRQVKEPQSHEGMVVSASADQVSMKAADGKEHTFKINEMTRVTVNGKPGKLTDLKPGIQIRVMVDQAGKVASVSTVDDRK